MIIGTARIEESATKNSREGYHQFLTDATHLTADDEEYGSFEIFFISEAEADQLNADATAQGGFGFNRFDEPDLIAAGWYWAAGFPGCLHDGDPIGPFTDSIDAYYDARS